MALQRLSPAQQPVLASSRRPNPNPKSARAPNLYYQALPMEQLRRYSRFVPLPPVEDVLISGSSTYR